MRRWVPVILTALVVTLSACGGATSSDSAPTATGAGAVKLIAGSADKAADLKTARISGEVTIEAKGERKTLPIDGAMDFGTGAFEFTYDMSQLLPGAGAAKIDARMVDGVMYMNLGDLMGGIGASKAFGDKKWVKLDLHSLGLGANGASGLGDANPGGTLDVLRGADDVRVVGTETVRGVSTTHYRATVDARKALDQTPEALRDRVKQGLALLHGSIPVDVWIDGDGHARKVSMSIDADVAKVSTTIEYFDFGTPVEVTAPPAGEVIDFSDMLGSLRGASLGGTPAV